VNPDASDEKRMSDLVEKLCLDSPSPCVPGSYLGLQLKKEFPDVDLKQIYGGLRQFLREHCSNIVRVKPTGMDFLYAHKQRTSEESSEPGDRETNVWQVFSDPRIERNLFFSRERLEFSILPLSASAPEGFEEFPRLSEDDYRQIAREYQGAVDNKLAEQLSPLVDQPGFWFPFTAKIRTLVGEEKFRNEFLGFRLEKIKTVLNERLQDILSDETSVKAVLKSIRRAKSSRQKRKPTISAKSEIPAHYHLPGDTTMRSVAHSVVDAMSEGELAQMWVPFGAMFKVIGARNGKS